VKGKDEIVIEASLPLQSVETKKITRKRLLTVVTMSRWSLPLILAFQALISWALLHNTAFQDEALYLYAGRQLFRYWMGGPVPLDHYAFYFSGYPGVYPVIGGVLDMIGGLELARSFSLFCMMGVNAIIYYCTQKFFQRPSAIFASATYACLGTVLFVGRLATFDALCLFLIALAAAIAYQVSTSRHPWLALMIGPLLVLSVLAKYAAMLFALPVLGILVFSTIVNQGWWRMLLRLALAIVTLVISLVVAYHFMDKAAFHAIAGSTTNRVALIQKSPLELFMHVLQMGGIVYAAALLGLVLVFFHYKRFLLIALLLFASSWLVPAYHIYKQEAVSLDKHMAFALFFAMPLAGCALAWLSGYMQRTVTNSNGRHWLAGLAVVLLVFTLGMQQSQTIYAQWADTSGLSYVLHTQMRDGSGRYLVEDIEVARYDAKDVTELWQWNGVNYFYYVTAANQQLLGDPALTQAIKDRYFALVELSFNYQPAEARFIAQQMAASKNYDLIARVPFQNSFGTGHFYIWRSAAVAGQGNFTGCNQAHLIPANLC
jgi:4-amino-4-deoxy-L-arabinose transferase-like glycosyltransferase